MRSFKIAVYARLTARFGLSICPNCRAHNLTQFAPIALRLAAISIVGLLLFKGLEAVFFPSDVLGAATVEQITSAIRAKSPNLTPTQIEQFIQSLREARGDPSFQRAVEEAKKGNTRVAEGIWHQIYEDRKKEQKHDGKNKHRRRATWQPAQSPVTLRKDCLGIEKRLPSILQHGGLAWIWLCRPGGWDPAGSRPGISPVR